MWVDQSEDGDATSLIVEPVTPTSSQQADTETTPVKNRQITNHILDLNGSVVEKIDVLT